MPSVEAFKIRRASLFLSFVFTFSLFVAVPAHATAATVSSLSPSSGTVSGGTTVTITGTGFTNATGLSIGSDSLTLDTNASLVSGEWKIVSDTSIQFITPVRTGTSLTVGPQAVVVANASGNSNSNVTYAYKPDLLSPNLNLVYLGDLASRSKGKSVSRTSSAPYMVTGTDSITGDSYTFESDFYYNPSSSTAYLRESFEVPNGTASLTTNQTGTDASVQVLSSSGNCPNHDNYIIRTGVNAGTTSQDEQTYCSAFGPEVYSEAFYATTSQAISFEWKATGGQDDYEVYAFLVSVSDSTTIPTPSTSNNKLVLHNMGDVQATYRTTSANIPNNGLYRFRFVNGTYDATGGLAIGAKMFIGKIVTVANSNSISFPTLSDRIAASSDTTDNFSFDLTSTSGAQITVAKSGICTVTTSYTSPTTTVTVTKSTGTGTCSITASQGASGNYAAASDVTKAFDYRTAAAVPDAPTINSITPGDGTLSINFTAPNRDGGATITNYSYSIDGVNYTPFSPAGTSSPVVISNLTGGTSYTVTIKAINSVGSSVASNSVSGTPTGGSSGSGSSVSSNNSAPKLCGVSGRVAFLGDSSRITYTARMRLNAIAKQLMSSGCRSVSLVGHTATLTNSSDRTEARRVALSKARNASVQKYLESQLKLLGHTVSFTTEQLRATSPLGSNKSFNGRLLNRRVDIVAN